jgi:glycosyltransferase involved in cell wall biosynthesis
VKKIAQTPLVSVVIPVYNGNGFLPSAIESILDQTYKNFEVIIIDDGSTDNSYEIMKNYAKTHSRLRIFRNPKNINIANTLNRGIKLARGQYIARMDADDVALPNRLSRQIKFMKSHRDVVILGGQVKTINIDGKTIGRKLFPKNDQEIREALFTTNPIQHPTAIIDRSLLPKNFSWYNPALPPAEDYDLFFRLGQYGLYHNLDKFVLKYRQYLGSSTLKSPVKTVGVTRKVRKLARTKYGYVPTPKALLIHYLQVAVVAIIPDFLIYPIYAIVRGIRSPFQLLADYLAGLNYLPNSNSLEASKLSA